jgi:penicillin-binding protein 2
MPGWLIREQYKADSVRAYFYYKLTKDSSYIKKFIRKAPPPPKKDSSVPKTRIAFIKIGDTFRQKFFLQANKKNDT